MPKFAANLTMLFTEAPFMERFALARMAGFKYVEYLFPYAYPLEDLKGQLKQHGLQQVLFNLPSGNWAAGDRGIAANPARIEEFRSGIPQAIQYAQGLGVTQVNCLVGKRVPDRSDAEQWAALVENVRFAARALGEQGIRLVIEAINQFDIPGFFLNRTEQVSKLIQDAGQPNVFIQYDIYHAQRQEGELVATIRAYAARIGHVQLADNPGRHQPGTGEIDYPFVLKALDATGYRGFVGLEYVPQPDSASSFGWIKEFGYTL
jgi:hydroxypyruvate isomerase